MAVVGNYTVDVVPLAVDIVESLVLVGMLAVWVPAAADP